MGTRPNLKQFAAQLEHWYKRYTKSPYFHQHRNVEAGLSRKASDVGHLDKGDLLWIAIWGSDEKRHQLGTLICDNNTSEDVVRYTREAIQKLDSSADALRRLLCTSYVGPAYGSKALRCICPQNMRHLITTCAKLVKTSYPRWMTERLR